MTNRAWPALAAALLGLPALTGCSDDLPTIGGPERFPGGTAPTTIEVLIPAGDVVLRDAVYDNFDDPREAPYLIVAEEFDGVLDAHSLARFSSFPTAVTFSFGGTSRTDSVFTYVSGEIKTVVNRSASTVDATRLLLWSVEQPWDSAEVTWQNASSGEPWTVPGGTRGELLAEATWAPQDTVATDTVVWQLDSLAVRRVADAGSRGVMVTSGDAGRRLQLRDLELRVTVRPQSAQDTTVAVAVGAGAQTFVFTPAPPVRPGIYRVGGVTGARTVLELQLIRELPGCSPALAATCPTVSIRDVTVNLAELVLQPLPVPSGFRPLGTSQILLRRVVEPELGRVAPLGQPLVSDTVPGARFVESDPAPVRVSLTSAIQSLVQTDSTTLAVALLGEGGAGQFGYQWYEGAPVIRLVYTLPLTPRLP